MATPVQTFEIAATKYSIHPHHRNGHPEKSQWTIDVGDEVESFTKAQSQQWLAGDRGWGVFPTTGLPNYVGVGVNRTVRLVIAKFVLDEPHNVWHGYPANHVDNERDIPDIEILKKWIEGSVLPIAKISKIGKGKPCSL